MYKLHLILKYLRKRRIAWVSLIAVMLCTAMVLVVISVMGGWLRMFRASFKGMSGDVIVQAESLTGFPHYQEIIDRAEALPEVEAAVPVIRTYGLINISNAIRQGVEVMGMPLDQIGRVNRFPESLYRQHVIAEEAGVPATQPTYALPYPDERYEAIREQHNRESWPGMIVGSGVVGLKKGADAADRERMGLYDAWANLLVLGMSAEQRIDIESQKADRVYWIVDDSRTGIWQYDQKTVYVPFEVLQTDLGMQGEPATEDYLGDPARASEVHIKTREGANLVETRAKVQQIVDQVMSENMVGRGYPVAVETWEEANALWLGAVEKEKRLVTFLFGIISLVAIFLIFCIFYMIVVEKTKDIGIIKSVGASSPGVAGIFLGYGLAIGLVGSGLGLLVSWLIVRNINEIHAWMGEVTERLSGTRVVVWDAEVYAFDTIPNTMDPQEVMVIVIVAILASVLGALVPAIRAARMNPVEALRWE